MDGWMDGLVKNFDKAWFLQFAHHLEFLPNGLTIDETLGQTPLNQATPPRGGKKEQ
jgi:hypothetical protein